MGCLLRLRDLPIDRLIFLGRYWGLAKKLKLSKIPFARGLSINKVGNIEADEELTSLVLRG
jgi:hypothetical protein